MPIVYSYNISKGRRDKNDDAVVAAKNIDGDGLAVVCDGIGSHSNAAYSSNYIIDTLESAWKNSSFDNFSSMKEWLENKIDDLNMHLYNKSQESQKKMGTTFVVIATCKDRVVAINIGDSRGYAISKNNEIKLITVDDSFVGALIDAGVLTEEEAKNHPEKHTLTQAIAIKDGISKHIFEDELAEYNYFLVCSDGLSNTLSEEEIKNVVEEEDLSSATKKLIDLSIERGSTDNISVAILQNIRGEMND